MALARTSARQAEEDESWWTGVFSAVGVGAAVLGAVACEKKEDQKAFAALGLASLHGGMRSVSRMHSLSEARLSEDRAGKLMLAFILSKLAYKSYDELDGMDEVLVQSPRRQCDDWDISRWFLASIRIPGQGESLWLVFRGTTCCLEWILNFMCVPAPSVGAICSGKGKIHLGFQTATAALLRDASFLQALAHVASSGLPLNLVGHSLGGAIAMTVASYLSDFSMDINKGEVIMFGSPPVHHQTCKTTAQLGFDVTLVVNQEDIVPRLLTCYKDSGKELLFQLIRKIRHATERNKLVQLAQNLTDGWKHPAGMSLYVLGSRVLTEVPQGLQSSWLATDSCLMGGTGMFYHHQLDGSDGYGQRLLQQLEEFHCSVGFSEKKQRMLAER